MLTDKFALLIFFINSAVCSNSVSGIRNISPHVNTERSVIIVTWEYNHDLDGVQYIVRYHITNRPEAFLWKYRRTEEKHVQISLENLKDGDELYLQVKAERNGKLLENWAGPLILTVVKQAVEEASGGNNLLPPLDFNVIALSPNVIRLEWAPQNGDAEGLYYLIDVKQIKTYVNYMQLGELIPGEKYEITVRSATGPERISSSAAITEITMPNHEEFFRISSIQINTLFRSHLQGSVNLTWDVPFDQRRHIKAFKLFYKEPEAQDWLSLYLNGLIPKASFTDLKSDTEYLLKVHTVLKNGMVIESGQFKFRTSKFVDSPISDVKVVFMPDGDKLKLQWTLDSKIFEGDISSYLVYITDDSNLNIKFWDKHHTKTNEIALPLELFKPLTAYYVKIFVKKHDDTIIEGPNIYRFQTLAHFVKPLTKKRTVHNVRFTNIGTGRVQVSWSYTQGRQTAGSTLFYTDQENLPLQQWIKLLVEDSEQTSVMLINLRLGARYFLRIVPDLCTGACDFTDSSLYQFVTEQNVVTTEVPKRMRVPPLPPTENVQKPRVLETATSSAFQDMRIREEEKHLCLTVCNPDSIRQTCNYDERCIASLEDPSFGWCVKERLRDAIMNS